MTVDNESAVELNEHRMKAERQRERCGDDKKKGNEGAETPSRCG